MANLKLIRELCKRRSITIRELANRINKKPETISAMMNVGSTSTATLEDIADVLQVHPGYFFTDYEESNVADLQKEIDHLRQLLAEKERTIEILLSKRK